MAFIEMKNIYKTFGKQDAAVKALQGASLEVNRGEMVAVMGKSGSGKSTLLNILGGLMTMDQGEIYFKDQKIDFSSNRALINYRRKEVGFIVQYFALVEELNIFENVALPLRYQGIPRKKIKKSVLEVLDDLGILEKAKSYPPELSGGQQQRASIARAIVKNPKLILADEPTGALDEATSQEVMSIFSRLKNDGRTLVIVTHDKKVAEYCDRIVFLQDGKNV